MIRRGLANTISALAVLIGPLIFIAYAYSGAQGPAKDSNPRATADKEAATKDEAASDSKKLDEMRVAFDKLVKEQEKLADRNKELADRLTTLEARVASQHEELKNKINAAVTALNARITNEKIQIGYTEAVFKSGTYPAPTPVVLPETWGSKVLGVAWYPVDSVVSVRGFGTIKAVPFAPNKVQFTLSYNPPFNEFLRVGVLVIYEK